LFCFTANYIETRAQPAQEAQRSYNKDIYIDGTTKIPTRQQWNRCCSAATAKQNTNCWEKNRSTAVL